MATGHLRKRTTKNGKTNWQLIIECERNPLTGKRNRHYQTITGTKKEAESTLRKLILQYETGSPVKVSNLLTKDWMMQWLALYLPNIEATTRASYEEKIKAYIIPELGYLPLKSLNAPIIQMWVNKLYAQNKLAPKTIRNVYLNLNAALNKAVTLQMLPYNPTAGVVLPKGKKYNADVYSQTEIEAMMTAAKDTDMHTLLCLAVYVGLRRGELVGLRWEDVDITKGIIHIRNNTVLANGAVLTKAPKSTAGIRDVAIGSKVVAELIEVKKLYEKNKVAYGSDFVDSGLVICMPNGKGFRPDSITQKWDRFVKQNNLRKIRFHDLRHTCATLMAQAGVSPKTAQERLGHADINVTMNVYTHSTMKMNTEAAALMDNLM